MADQDFVLALATAIVSVSIALEPVFCVINSLMLLSHPQETSGFSAWVTETAAKLPPELARRHQLVFNILFRGFEPTESWPSFPAYLDHLETIDPILMRDRAIDGM